MVPRKYYLWSIGCQMNDADSARAAEALERMGFVRVETPSEADVLLLNTCVVRQSAEDKVRGHLASLKAVKRRRPDAFLAVMGCFVDDAQPLYEQFPYVDLFLRPSDVDGFIKAVKERLALGDGWVRPPLPAPVSVYVPVVYGCDHFCTYCIVRLRRGRQKSRPLEEIATEVEELVKRGAREVILLGQNVNSYGRDLPGKPDLAQLLEAIHPIKGLWRIRFLTSHPADMSPRIIETVAKLPKVCEHFEIPVQSGDDLILKRMVRGYTVAQFRELVRKIRETIPGVSLATDVIVGFPGETEEQFMNTYRLLEEIRFDVVHVAAYSPRPGTAASRLKDDVPPEEKKRRLKLVEELQERISSEINAGLIGKEVEILVEGRRKGRWFGRTRTNKLVFFEDPGNRDGQMVMVKVEEAGSWSLRGRFLRVVSVE
ncbi:MAG: tRNA (N6-isopentenyl adenosine(37)-C2)-methylthiotransferase MiaB [Anaerolineae bacterium]|nr:tRNA (N6-isopentenyl adenosine(37)-C2)-methylthiotransferase MiaB [Anaerolineae bacterium]MDW8101336.1 tRNA (N6-isopentenyl adenosine(37)-C2)-methylthiotransferase MiaB [Anaerolineae bacterium]